MGVAHTSVAERSGAELVGAGYENKQCLQDTQFPGIRTPTTSTSFRLRVPPEISLSVDGCARERQPTKGGWRKK